MPVSPERHVAYFRRAGGLQCLAIRSRGCLVLPFVVALIDRCPYLAYIYLLSLRGVCLRLCLLILVLFLFLFKIFCKSGSSG